MITIVSEIRRLAWLTEDATKACEEMVLGVYDAKRMMITGKGDNTKLGEAVKKIKENLSKLEELVAHIKQMGRKFWKK